MAEGQAARDQLHTEVRDLTSKHVEQSNAYLARQVKLNSEVDTKNKIIQDQHETAA